MRRLIDKLRPSQTLSQQLPVKNALWRRIKLGIYSLGILVLASTSVILLTDHDHVSADLLRISADAGLRLNNIQVRGRAHTPTDTLLTTMGLELGTPILGIDLVKLHQDISNIGWVETAIVERRLPATIHITIRERIPIALLQTSDAHRLIDHTGTIINDADPREFTHLRVVTGNDAAIHAERILAVLKTEPELFSEVWAVSFRAKRRWDVHLKNGMEIRLPEIDPVSAWARLAVIDRKKEIISRDLAVIDLRIPQQLIVEPNIPVRGKGSKT